MRWERLSRPVSVKHCHPPWHTLYPPPWSITTKSGSPSSRNRKEKWLYYLRASGVGGHFKTDIFQKPAICQRSRPALGRSDTARALFAWRGGSRAPCCQPVPASVEARGSLAFVQTRWQAQGQGKAGDLSLTSALWPLPNYATLPSTTRKRSPMAQQRDLF